MFEKEAEEIANKRCHEIMCYGHCSFSSPKHHRCGEWHREYNCAKEGAEFGYNKANEWHDLRKDPNDLPAANWKNWVLAVYDNGTLWCRARREECTDGVYWVNSYHNVIHDVVMWAKVEIPTFKE